MPLTGKQKAVIVIGSLTAVGVITAIAIYKATATVPIAPYCGPGYHWDSVQKTCVRDTSTNCPTGYHWDTVQQACVPNPPPPCPRCHHWDSTQNKCVPTLPGTPFKVNTQTVPSSIYQNLAFYGTKKQPPGYICLQCGPYLSASGNTVYGLGSRTSFQASFQVVDSAGCGVPNIQMRVWPLQSTDAHGGIIFINGQQATALTPIRVVTDSNGIFNLFLEYHETNTTINLLKNIHDICCAVSIAGVIGWCVGSVSYPNGCCGLAWIPFPTVPVLGYVNSQTATFPTPTIYTIHAEMVGAPAIFTEITLSAQFQSKCFW